MPRHWPILVLAAVLTAQSDFQIQTIAGSNRVGDGGPAATATIRQVEGIAFDAAGGIYIADAADHRVRAISANGVIRTVAGTGVPGFDGDGGPSGRALLHSPYGLSVDRAGNVYIADLGNARIRRVNTSGQIETVAGGGSIWPAGADGTLAVQVKLSAPRNVLADANGGFYFSDFEAHRVFYVDGRGILTTFAGTGLPGYGADNIAATRSSLRNPAGLAFDSFGSVIIAESGAHRFRRVARGLVTAYLDDFLRLNPVFGPTGIAIDSVGNTYLADSRTVGALMRTPRGEAVALATGGRAVAADPRGGAVYGGGAAVVSVDSANRVSSMVGGSGTSAQQSPLSPDSLRLAAPSAVIQDRQGNLYIADELGHRVYGMTASGLVTKVAGSGQPAYSGDGGPAIQAGLNAPRALALDRFGNLFIADAGNHSIRRIAPNGIITTVAGNGFKGRSGDLGPAVAARLDSPSGLATGPFDDLFISDSGNNQIRRLSPNGLLTNYVDAVLSDPRGLATDTLGTLYVAEAGGNRIRRIDASGKITALGEGQFRAPRGVAMSSEGSVFVADTGNHRVCRLDGTVATTIAGNGEPGFEGDGASATTARLQFPSAVAISGDDGLLIADTGNYRIRRLSPATLPQIGATEMPAVLRNAASGQTTAVVPGMVAEIEYREIEGVQPINGAPVDGQLPVRLGDFEILVNGSPTGLYLLGSKLTRFRFPITLAAGTAEVRVRWAGAEKGVLRAPVATAAPALFPMIVREDGTASGIGEPAARGSVVSVFGTGEGSQSLDSVSVTVGGLPAQVEWAGPLEHLPGVFQINFRVPSGFLASGPHAVELRLGPYAAANRLVLHLQ